MKFERRALTVIGLLLLACILAGCSDRVSEAKPKQIRLIVTSDSILSTMAASVVPSPPYFVTAILPPGQCPGHYDMRLSDIERIKKADLIISFKGAPFMGKATGPDSSRHLVIDTAGRNAMVPDAYVHNLHALADRLSEYFPEDRDTIMGLREKAIRSVDKYTASLIRQVRDAGLSGKPVIAASMQKQPLEWMGFRVVGEYGRPETMSARDIMRLVRTGKKKQAIFVADNLQSGPRTGKGIAESLGIPHIVLSNFPSDKGYLSTLGENVETVLAAYRSQHNSSVRVVRP